MAAQLYAGGKVQQALHDKNLFNAYVADQAKIEQESKPLLTQTHRLS